MSWSIRGLSVLLSLLVLLEVNYPQLSPQSQLAFFSLFGLVLVFLFSPTGGRRTVTSVVVDCLLIGATVFCCLYVVVQTEPSFRGWWSGGMTLGDRAGAETRLDFLVGVLGVLLVLEATRRSLGWALPILASVFLAYSYFGAYFPSWSFPHRGYTVQRIVAQTFLHSQGVFGIALSVMFSYVFLFVLLGAFLEATGATGFIVSFARRLFRKTPGGAAKVAVLASGMMGSLSGSAVANTATTGTFTIPLMRSIGFKPHIAAGITAAASSGGALVPPVMGAGAYMMLEMVTPAVTYLEVIRAALLPALLYYLALFLIVHFYAKRVGAGKDDAIETELSADGSSYKGLVFFVTLGSLVGFLLLGYTVFRAVSLSLAIVVVLSSLSRGTRLDGKKILEVFTRTARGGVPLIVAAGCVGLVLGVVTLTGVGTKFPSAILDLSGQSTLLALTLIMLGSIFLGMGLPSAVCYLLMATLIGPVVGELGIIPLAAHFFIFYFGMMSMVTPPVALAGYTAASIAETDIMRTSFAAFRFALVGFTLPFMFVFRPELLFLSLDGTDVGLAAPMASTLIVIAGIVPLAAGIAGYFRGPLSALPRALMFLAAALLFYPSRDFVILGAGVSIANVAGLAVVAALVMWHVAARPANAPAS